MVLVLCLCLLPAAVTAQEEATAAVEIGDFFFAPDSIEVAPNTTVVWTNNGEVLHTVTSDDGVFDSGELNPGDTFEYTFTDPGTYGYFCTIHPAMTAEVVVTAENATGPSVVVEDQEIVADTVMVATVVSDGPGWIVIHADQNGTPGPILGYSPVADGENTDVPVSIDMANVTATLYAMLHIDAGTVGVFEFPGPDEPVTVDGQVLAPPFAVTTPSTAPTDVDLELVAENFTSPVGAVPAPDGSGRLFIVDQTGFVRIMEANGTMLERPFLDVSGRMVGLNPSYDERGLLGFAFHPNFTENGEVYVYYSAPLRESGPDGWDHTARIAQYTVSPADPLVVMTDSERPILEVDEPQANHNGGQIAFGPDGYLYIALGDGGGAADVGTGHPPDGNGQNTTTLLGSILRIDVDGEEPYAIPADNPFANGTAGLPEIYAYGLRNPARISFDEGGTGELFAGDAGQNRWEEVDIVTLGSNYGWNLKEGTHCFDPEDPTADVSGCPDTGSRGEPLIDPIIEYQNAAVEGGIGQAVIGGYLYRGSAIPSLTGLYVFGDWSGANERNNGILFAAAPPLGANETMWQVQDLEVASTPRGDVGGYLLGFGKDADDELLVLTTESAGPNGTTGKVFRLIAAGNVTPAVVPAVTVRDQPIENGSVIVDEVISDGPGWIVIHADQNSTPGPVLGYSPVMDGTTTNVTVTLNETANITETLYAMLHVDAGTVGVYEFPGPDGPVMVDGVVLAPPFRVLETAETMG